MRLFGEEDPFALAEEMEARRRALAIGAQILEMPEVPTQPHGESRIGGVSFDGYIHHTQGNGLGADADPEAIRVARRLAKRFIRIGQAASYNYQRSRR